MSRTRNAARKTACPAASRAGARSEGEETTKVMSKAIESIGGRTVLTVVAAVLALAVFGGAATAVTRTCEADCFGTRKADTLTGNGGGYDFFGKAGRDLVRARGGDDELLGQTGAWTACSAVQAPTTNSWAARAMTSWSVATAPTCTTSGPAGARTL